MSRTLLRLTPAVALLASSLLSAAEPDAAPAVTPAEIRQAVASSMDMNADPCDDFYRYACGGWLDSTKLPADQSRWTRSFSVITERNREVVRALLEDAAKNPGPAGTERQKIGDFYAACMDEAAIEKAGTQPIAAELAAAGKVADAPSLFAAVGRLHRARARALFSFSTMPDFKNPTLNIGFLSQGGLGLPDRDYYVSDDPKKKAVLGKYEAHVARTLTLAGAAPDAAAARADAAKIVALETSLARAARPREEMRQREKIYNRIDRPGLEKLAPALPWAAYFEGIGYPSIREINVAVPEFVTALGNLVAGAAPEASWDAVRAYLRWNAVNAAAEHLSRPLVEADFDFYGRTLQGQAEIEPRWKRCVDATSGALGEAIGKLYVESQFPGESKQVALEMIHDIEGAFESNLPGLAWMDDVTRQRAVEKMHKVANKIGYPEVWRDYSPVTIGRDSYFANVRAGGAFEFDRQMKKIGNPVDRREWLMTPQRVNAYYNPTMNEIAFPAGILQPPFFHKDHPAAMNYGAIGAVVGHELTHGFDDQGRKSDGDGVLREWWEPAVAAKFEQAARCVDDQFSQLEVEPGVKVNGKLTLGENIADLGGMKEAYLAYQSWEKRHGQPEPLVPGLTDEQLFFVSWAQTWCTLSTPEYLRQQVTVDPHSPGMFRAIGAPRNSPEFQRAFACEAGDKMVAAPVCTVW